MTKNTADTPAAIEADFTLPANDGYTLAATLYEAEPASHRVVVINSATAVPRQFYTTFARYLVREGFSVVTYDYRGIGGSRPKKMRGFSARIRDWALEDMTGVLNWVRANKNPEKLHLIGHSFGGQTAGLLEKADDIDSMLTLSSQSGYWRLQGGEQKFTVLIHTWFTMPLITSLLGYIPFGGQQLPGKVAREWAGWCRNRLYLLGDKTLPLERFKAFTAPVLAYSIDDDKWGTARSVDAMMGAYPNMKRRHIAAADQGLKSLGHFGFFRRNAEPFWADVSAWLKG
ncbi:MAG: alpha/beta fold hydrolase [Sneathiella sp.]